MEKIEKISLCFLAIAVVTIIVDWFLFVEGINILEISGPIVIVSMFFAIVPLLIFYFRRELKMERKK